MVCLFYVITWHKRVIVSRASSGCKLYHIHSWVDIINLVAGISLGWNFNSLGTNVSYSGRKEVCDILCGYSVELRSVVSLSWSVCLVSQHKNFFPHLAIRFFFFCYKDGFVSLIISRVHCSYAFIIFLKNTSVNVLVKL